MMLRRVTITLAGVAAAAFMAAGPAAAAPAGNDSGTAAAKKSSATVEYFNLGGRWGITHAVGHRDYRLGFYSKGW